MTDKYEPILNWLLSMCANRHDVKCVIAIGSQCRKQSPADEYSDLDLIIACDSPEALLYRDEWLTGLGGVLYSFVENTLFDQKERRVLFEGLLDVDFIVIETGLLSCALDAGQLDRILCRGYDLLYDAAGLRDKFARIKIAEQSQNTVMSESEFKNLVNDFYYHVVWTQKKLARGELWTAKMCVDSYMKQLLLALIELHEESTWHNGRMLENWTSANILEELHGCFAHYDANDIALALEHTNVLFTRLARDCARKFGYVCGVDAIDRS